MTTQVEFRTTGDISIDVDRENKVVTVLAATAGEEGTANIFGTPAASDYTLKFAEGVDPTAVTLYVEVPKSSKGTESKSKGSGCIEREYDYN